MAGFKLETPEGAPPDRRRRRQHRAGKRVAVLQPVQAVLGLEVDAEVQAPKDAPRTGPAVAGSREARAVRDRSHAIGAN
jgi:hypothetical protein